MSSRSTRSLLRWVHIFAASALAVYVYSPLHADPVWTDVTRLGLVPLMAMSGVWMWQQRYFAQMFSPPDGG